MVYGLYYNITKSKWEYGKFPFPSVIYRRDFHQPPKIVKKLSRVTKGRLFNSYRFTKLKPYDFVSTNPDLAASLPPTESLISYYQLESFIGRHSKVILKPVDLSRGRGICIIEKTGDDYKVVDYRSKHPSELILKGNENLERFFEVNETFHEKYLIQKFIPLATINNSLFDIRVVMQKDHTLQWQCTGIVTSLGKRGGVCSNYSKDDKYMSFEEFFGKFLSLKKKEVFQKKQELIGVCKKACKVLDESGENYADLGVDIGLDRSLKPWVFELNNRLYMHAMPLLIDDYDVYYNVRTNPIRYAVKLSGFNIE